MDIIKTINLLDIITLLIIGYAFISGYHRGFINVLFDTLAIGVSFFVASKYHMAVNEFFRQTFHIKGAWTLFLTLLLTYIASFFFFKIMGLLLTKYFIKTPIGVVNKISGMFLNGLKWFFIIIVMIMIIMRFPSKELQKYCKKALVFSAYKEVVQIPVVKKFAP